MILTIDDGPRRCFLSIAEICKEKNYETLFFCIGSQIYHSMIVLKKVIKMGFEIHNHSYSHIRFSDASLERCQMEILSTEFLIDRIYSELNMQRKRKLFRFPFGDNGGVNKSQIQKMLLHYGFVNLDSTSSHIDTKWDLDIDDLNPNFDPKATPELQGIVLMHDCENALNYIVNLDNVSML